MMTRMMMPILALVSLLLFALPGCSIFGDPVAEKVASAIDKYCEEPFNQRQVYRETVNAKLGAQGHAIQVTCAGDPVPETRHHDVDAWSHVGLHAALSESTKPET